jgi:nitrite reductase (cytochrome c-552)
VKARAVAFTLVCALGAPVGVGAFTFLYAKGFSYLSSDPRSCVNCHIMNEQYDAWAKSGHRHAATCVECHLPHEGLAKWVAKAEHGVRSPLLNVNRACQSCHAVPEEELRARVLTIQDRHYALLQRAARATTDMLDAIVAAKKTGATETALKDAATLHRKAQWRLDFVAAENSMGFHAPQELARILGEAIDYARQGQRAVEAAARR